MRSILLVPVALLCAGAANPAHASIFGQVHGVVHDLQHRPVANAHVELQAATSAFHQTIETQADGSFALGTVPLGVYTVAVTAPGFASVRQTLTLASDTSPVLHFELGLLTADQSVEVTTDLGGASVGTVTPTTLISRGDIARTPGADRTNSLAMITDFVPGAYVTHDQLHIRGGHQVSWLLDGVQIPNTNIAGNLGAQIDPKDIDFIEVARGSYAADVGDRTYGVFNVVPRTGFERDRTGELQLSAGSFFQTDNQVSLGDHTGRFAWYASANGNRSDYGLAPPVGRVLHDRANGFGGFGSVIFNRTPKDQLRLLAEARADYFQIPYDPDPASSENFAYASSGLRDGQHENDLVVAPSWIHSFSATTVLQVSPFLHRNRAAYESPLTDEPIATTSDRASLYTGAQVSLTAGRRDHTLEAGLLAFGQHDANRFGATFNDGTGSAPFDLRASTGGGVVEFYASDAWKVAPWLTVTAGLRRSHFTGDFTEDATAPRIGLAVRVPKLGWVFRGFYGRFYQPPPLVTAAGPLLDYARANNTAFVSLHGERDEEHQFGVAIPWRGWVLDADTFRTRVNNFLDHANIGNSNLYFPVTIEGALVRAWEATLRSPRLLRFGQAHLAYSNQIAEQRGPITGGLVCTPIGSPACAADFVYRPVDHDQRNTLNAGFAASLPRGITASTNVYFGSGFTNGGYSPDAPPSDPRYPNPYLPAHTSVDLALAKTLGERASVGLTATNITNRRLLLDNSLTFGGFHFNDPRQIFATIRYRFKF